MENRENKNIKFKLNGQDYELTAILEDHVLIYHRFTPKLPNPANWITDGYLEDLLLSGIIEGSPEDDNSLVYFYSPQEQTSMLTWLHFWEGGDESPDCVHLKTFDYEYISG